ncbi:hypothetical protein [Streptomyces sp. NPDC003720]|uniref:hypothetical protein n=1 Tax=Streptomyces sp. NPDC003720 TaxID=3364684 RepID=UPI00368FE37C
MDAPMFLRVRNGKREAVHARAEDEERHTAPLSDEHIAFDGALADAEQVGHAPGAALVLAGVDCFGPLPNVLAAPLADPYNRGSSPLRIIKGQTKPGGGGAV